jgi:hypothetical protein
MYTNAYSIFYTPTPLVATSTASSSVDVGMRATFYGIMFKINDLVSAAAIAAKTSENISEAYPNNSFSISGLDSLVFTPSAPISGTNQPVNFTLKGSFTVTGTFPTDDIVSQLEGKNLAQSNAIFAAYSTIASAHAIITPFWRHSFPDSAAKISIIIQ